MDQTVKIARYIAHLKPTKSDTFGCQMSRLWFGLSFSLFLESKLQCGVIFSKYTFCWRLNWPKFAKTFDFVEHNTTENYSL